MLNFFRIARLERVLCEKVNLLHNSCAVQLNRAFLAVLQSQVLLVRSQCVEFYRLSLFCVDKKWDCNREFVLSGGLLPLLVNVDNRLV